MNYCTNKKYCQAFWPTVTTDACVEDCTIITTNITTVIIITSC